MNPHVAKKLVQAVSNRYFRRVRCVMEHRTAKDRRRTMHWEYEGMGPDRGRRGS